MYPRAISKDPAYLTISLMSLRLDRRRATPSQYSWRRVCSSMLSRLLQTASFLRHLCPARLRRSRRSNAILALFPIACFAGCSQSQRAGAGNELLERNWYDRRMMYTVYLKTAMLTKRHSRHGRNPILQIHHRAPSFPRHIRLPSKPPPRRLRMLPHPRRQPSLSVERRLAESQRSRRLQLTRIQHRQSRRR
jgi:hypothetical protein